VAVSGCAGKNGGLSERPLVRRNALEMIYRRAKQAGIAAQIGCHTFRATGITIYLSNGGTLEKAQMMAVHSSAEAPGFLALPVSSCSRLGHHSATDESLTV
jgi:integrase